MKYSFVKEVDALGLKCPEPVMLLHNAVRDVAADEIVRLVATDPSTLRDIKNFCEFLGHKLIDVEEQNNQFTFFVQKKS